MNKPFSRRSGCLVGCLLLTIVPFIFVVSFILIYVLFPPDPLDILILGVDARAGQGYLTRTDSVLLLNVTPNSSQITLLSIPRDAFINVPNYGEQRINTINLLGEQDKEGSGPDLVKASIVTSFDINIDRYIRLDFQAFAAMVDAVGGVNIEVPKLIVDYQYPTADGGTITIRFDPGNELMNGERALQYVRTRHQDSDYHRAARQQQVMDALFNKLRSPAGIVYLPRVWQVIQSHTDTDLGLIDVARMGPALIFGWGSREQRVLQGSDLIGTQGGYWIPNYPALSPWIADHFD